jgi:hypothetical protein
VKRPVASSNVFRSRKPARCAAMKVTGKRLPATPAAARAVAAATPAVALAAARPRAVTTLAHGRDAAACWPDGVPDEMPAASAGPDAA